MKAYYLWEDFEQTFVDETDQGNMTLTLSKPLDTNLTNEVWGTVVIESKEKFEDNNEVRLCLEFGRRDHFMLTRRRRYALYGLVESTNFTDFTIATEKGSKANLTAYNWWCSRMKSDEDSRYDFYDYPASFYIAKANDSNNITKENNTISFKFKTSFE